MSVRNNGTRWALRSAVALFGCLLMNISHAECTALLLELPALGDPPHSARVTVNDAADCADVRRITAVLFSDDERIDNRTYFDEQLQNPPLRFPVADSLRAPRIAGSYRIQWTVDFVDDTTQVLQQPFVIPCQAPSEVAVRWSDEDNVLQLSVPSGDLCQGEITASLTLRDLVGNVPFDSASATYPGDSAAPLEVALALPRIEGERRYVGELSLTNAANLSRSVAVEFVTGCGGIDPRVSIVDGTYLGSVTASDCQFPIQMQIAAIHESGDTVQSVDALLKGHDFELPLPDWGSWPAGSYRIESQFVGMTARAKAENTLTIDCVIPKLSSPIVEGGGSTSKPEVVFSLQDRDSCQGATQLALQVRDLNDVVIFNRSVDLLAGSDTQSFRWAFDGIPGSAYQLDVSAAFGLNNSEVISVDAKVDYACQTPSIRDLGYSNPEATHVSALMSLTACNAPASAKLVVRNKQGRVVADADPQLLQEIGAAYAKTSPVSLGHLDTGQYSVTLSILDNSGRLIEKETTILRDIDGPSISFHHQGQTIRAGATPTLSSLSDLSLSFIDTTSPLSDAARFDHEPTVAPSSITSSFTHIDGETTPQIWITGLLDLDPTYEESGFVGVLAQGPDGNRWLIPIVRHYIPSTAEELRDYHPSRLRRGFRAVARVQHLAQGRYDLLGVVLANANTEQYLVSGNGHFSVTALSAQQPDALLRQGVTEIPIALNWSTNNSAALERISSVPDGDYTLSVVGRDLYGNPSDVHSLVIHLLQEKQSATLAWPAIQGYSQTVTHRFRTADSSSSGPLRVLYRRTEGYGAIKINGRRVTEQTTEEVLTAAPDGRYTMEIELLEADVDARFVLHPDSTNAVPLEMQLSTYRPEFQTQRKRTENLDVLAVSFSDQPCRRIVFSDLSEVSLRRDEVLCAVRISVPGSSTVSVSQEESEIRLPPGIKLDSLYEEGFVRVMNDQPLFQSTRQIRIADIQTYSATPQIEFQPLNRWRARNREGSTITTTGDTLAGHLLVRAGLGRPIIEVNDEPVVLSDTATGTVRVPIRTSIAGLGQSQGVSVKAYYPETPELVSSKHFEFFAVPDRLLVESVSGQLVSPGELEMKLVLLDGAGPYSSQRHGPYAVREATIVDRYKPDQVLSQATVDINEQGELRANLGKLDPGEYRLRLVLESEHDVYAKHLAPVRSESLFEILDGSALEARLFTFRATDKAPFFGQISVDYPLDRRRRDADKVSWQVSTDGKTFENVYCCGHSMDFALADPGTLHYRAQITNRHSGVTSTTKPLTINAFLSGDLVVEGPRNTFRGWPAKYRVKDLPAGYDVIWRVTAPNAAQAVTTQSPSITIDADVTGTYYVEVIADALVDRQSSVAALRTYFTLDVSWPRIPESVITGPTQVEFGKSEVYTVSHPPVFRARGNPAIERVGEWELPDGSIAKDDEWTQFTLRDLPEGFNSTNIFYHTWLKDDRTTLTTAVHRIEPVRYRWPNWKLKIATNSLEAPSVLRLAVAPDNAEDWMGLGKSPLTTHWELSDHVRVIEQTETEAIVYSVDDRVFDVRVRVSDPRGNVTELSRQNVQPFKQVPFEISLRAVAERSLHTAPIGISAQVDPIVLPKGQKITRVAFYVDGLYRGVTDGSPLDLQIRTPGEHELRAIASINSEYTSDASITLSIGENQKASCSIAAIGNFYLNGLAKAQCDDPDGHMVDYRWYSDGQLLASSGTRVQLSRAELQTVRELSLIAVDNAGIEAKARFVPPPKD